MLLPIKQSVHRTAGWRKQKPADAGHDRARSRGQAASGQWFGNAQELERCRPLTDWAGAENAAAHLTKRRTATVREHRGVYHVLHAGESLHFHCLRRARGHQVWKNACECTGRTLLLGMYACIVESDVTEPPCLLRGRGVRAGRMNKVGLHSADKLLGVAYAYYNSIV